MGQYICSGCTRSISTGGMFKVGLIFCDHVMPQENGVDLLIDLYDNVDTIKTRKVLLTGQAGQEATIKAINSAGLNHYISKPWQKDDLLEVARKQLTEFIITCDINPLPYMNRLDTECLSKNIRRTNLLGDE
ncbi:MAG: response regulator [Verrucomicrobiota bacterium]